MAAERIPAPRDVRARMDRMYRFQQPIYDLTRKYYLFGRDRLIAGLDLRPGVEQGFDHVTFSYVLSMVDDPEATLHRPARLPGWRLETAHLPGRYALLARLSAAAGQDWHLPSDQF